MNKKRRERIAAVIKMLEQAYTSLMDIKDDEDEYRESIPENLQFSTAYEESEDWSYALEDAISSVDSAIDQLSQE